MRVLALLVAATLLISGCGEPRSTPHTVAVLLADDVRLPKVDGLRAGLAALGFSEDSVRIEVFSARGDRQGLAAAAKEAVQSRPEILVAGGGVEAVVLKELGHGETPLVLMGVASTVRSGLIDSFVRPGRPVTGLDNQHAELSAKRLELLVKLLPATRRVLVLYDQLVIPGRHALELTQEAAVRLGVTLHPLAVETAEQALSAVREIRPGQHDAALLLPAYVLEIATADLAPEWERLRLPVIGPLEAGSGGETGVLAAYGVSLQDQGYQSARFVAKLLQGQRAGRIPVETPDHPELVVDLGVAERFGLSLDPVGLAFARTVGGGGP